MSRRDIVLVDEEKKLLLFTIWKKFDQLDGSTLDNLIHTGPMLFGMRLRVTTFNSLSLTTRASSSLMINPPVVESLQMQEWYDKNKDQLQTLLELKSYKNIEFLLPYPHEEDIIPVAKAASLPSPAGWVRGKTCLLEQDRSSWYTVCTNCKKSMDAELTWAVVCSSCKVKIFQCRS